MDKFRIFRNDYAPLNLNLKFKSGDKAVILKVDQPNIKILVKNKSYKIPYRDFIILTKKIN